MQSRFRKKLRLLTFIALLVSISGGPFGMETMLPTSGPGMTLLLLVVIGPLFFGIPMILTVAELGSALPVEGGYYRWVQRALGQFWGFQVGWWSWLSALLDQALYPVFIVAVLDRFFLVGFDAYTVEIAGLSFRWLSWLICLAVIAPITWINVRGVHWVGNSAIGFNVLILTPYLIFVALALAQAQYNPFVPLVPAGQDLIDTMGYGLLVAMWNYSGFEAPSAVSEEIEDAGKSLRKGIIAALPLDIAIYSIPVVAALMVNNDWANWVEGSFVDIARVLGDVVPGGGGVLAFLIMVSSVVGCISIFNGGMLFYTRLQFAMADDGMLPRSLSDLHPRFDTPWKAILFNAALYSLLGVLPFQELLTVEIWLMIPGYLLIFLALLVIRWREPDLPRPFRVPGGAVGLGFVVISPSVISLVALWVSVHEVLELRSPTLIWGGLLGLASGPIAYAVSCAFRRWRA
jgi:amino acid transporter